MKETQHEWNPTTDWISPQLGMTMQPEKNSIAKKMNSSNLKKDLETV